jgi:hypothetical protein
MAEEMDRMLQVGSVYYISNGQLSGANRRYSTTGNDYRINFNQKTEVKAALDQVRNFWHQRLDSALSSRFNLLACVLQLTADCILSVHTTFCTAGC